MCVCLCVGQLEVDESFHSLNASPFVRHEETFVHVRYGWYVVACDTLNGRLEIQKTLFLRIWKKILEKFLK